MLCCAVLTVIPQKHIFGPLGTLKCPTEGQLSARAVVPALSYYSFITFNNTFADFNRLNHLYSKNTNQLMRTG